MTLRGKVAYITGGSAGIGEAACRAFAGQGAAVVIADVDAAGGSALAEELRGAGHRCLFMETDVRSDDGVARSIAEAEAQFGRIDILYNNAGGSSAADGPVTETPLDVFRTAYEVNVLGTWLVCRHGIGVLRRGGGGAIVNTSSTAALAGHPGYDAYTAAKGAVASLTRSMAVSLAANNIRVNAIAPGATGTRRVAQYAADGKIRSSWMDRHLLGLIDPADIASAALFLASDASRGMTGQIVTVDGGATITAVSRAQCA
ncbi:MAG: SDR family NAD(P)-dependent oxidoreductase [Sphingobium sp.]